jgi:mRNA-degrading endonuclease RelE of RelBE toxin-antitoxin system
MVMRIFATIQRFAETGEGDVKELKSESGELRLRVGDYRVPFTDGGDDSIRIHSFRHRRRFIGD